MEGQNQSREANVVILGAGPSGLGVALGVSLHSYDAKVTVLEKKSRVGGLAGSFTWKGHVIDYGPHRLSPNISAVRYLAEDILGPDCLVQKSQHGVVFRNKLYQFPPRVIDWLSVPSLFILMRFTSSFLAAKFSWIVRRFEADTFESLIKRKFGSRFYRDVVAPMAAKIWTEPKFIDPRFVNQRFAHIRPWAVVKKFLFPKQELNPASFYYPRKGFQQLWDNIAENVQLDGVEIFLESEPTRVLVREGKIQEITYKTTKGEKVLDTSSSFVVSTIPVQRLVQILDGMPKEELERSSSRTKVKSMILVAFEFDLPKALPFRTIIFPEGKYSFNRLFEQNEYSRATVSEGKSVVVADITLFKTDPFFHQSDEQIVERVKDDLKNLSFVPYASISDVTVRKVEFAYVIPDEETRREFHLIQHHLKKIRNLQVAGRFGAGEYDNSDYAIDNGLTLGAMLTNRISRLEYLIRIKDLLGRSIVG